MKIYLAKRQINHDNLIYEASDTLELDQRAARPLLTVGAIEEMPEEVQAESGESDESEDKATGKKSGKKDKQP